MPRRRVEREKRRRIRFLPFFFIILLFAVGVYTLSTLLRVLPSIIQSSEDSVPIRVEVLNGCGVPRLAKEISWELRRLGFDVVSIGDAHQKDFAQTVVIERRNENLLNARRLAKKIGCKKVIKDIDSTLYLEATLIIGNDYEELFPQLNLGPK